MSNAHIWFRATQPGGSSPVPANSRVFTLLSALVLFGCGTDAAGASGTADDAGSGPAPAVPCVADESAAVPAERCTTDPKDTTRPQCNTWIKVEVPGTICGDGSQYKFFVSYSNTSNNVVMEFEPGGACWDYESCSGRTGVRGAANPNGIADTHMATYGLLPLMNSNPADPETNPTKDYNKVFVSYCTGDIHTGNAVRKYKSTGPIDGGTGAGGTDEITFHHAGHANTLKVVEWMKGTFKTVPKLLVSGCSAGGAASLLNYAFIRTGLGNAVQCSYMLDDSGPIFHSDGPSKALHEKVRESWNTDPLFEEINQKIPVDVAALKQDFGLINTTIAAQFPADRFALTAYRMDFNYSLYSYQRFFPGATEAQIHAYWWEDLQALMRSYDTRSNMSYFIPFFRSDNCSHCDTIPPIGNPPLEPLGGQAVSTPWLGTEIQKDQVSVLDYVKALLDPKQPMKSYVEDIQPTEQFTPAVSALCMEGGSPLPGQ